MLRQLQRIVGICVKSADDGITADQLTRFINILNDARRNRFGPVGDVNGSIFSIWRWLHTVDDVLAGIVARNLWDFHADKNATTLPGTIGNRIVNQILDCRAHKRYGLFDRLTGTIGVVKSDRAGNLFSRPRIRLRNVLVLMLNQNLDWRGIRLNRDAAWNRFIWYQFPIGWD